MTNKEIAKYFNRLAKIMELHGENPFKIRSYTNAYQTLRRIETPLSKIPREELLSIKGIGKAIADKIEELLQTQELKTYKKYEQITPKGIIEMLDIRGFGPKKIKTIWRDLNIETTGELLYACRENRLVHLKGFGKKTQENLQKQLEYFIRSKGKFHYYYAEKDAKALRQEIECAFPDNKTVLAGEIKRMLPVLSAIEILTTIQKIDPIIEAIEDLYYDEEGQITYRNHSVKIISVPDKSFGQKEFLLNCGKDFLHEIEGDIPDGDTEEEVMKKLGISGIPPEYRETPFAYRQAQSNAVPELINTQDIKGVIHNHTTYSDGLHTLKEMADQCIKSGYEYLVITDHSKAAYYAEGMREEEVISQFKEIDALNKAYRGFKIFKGIECDILNDGSLDYDDAFRENFDLVIASIHSNLKMDKSKATKRLTTAIMHPHTRILGHPTGRLLLAREGYPIDHKTIIDACAEYRVSIEINANPQRLDLDWTWIPYAIEKGVLISINPDAHSRDQIDYIRAGISAARKGGLTAKMCLNAKPLKEFENWIFN